VELEESKEEFGNPLFEVSPKVFAITNFIFKRRYRN